MPVVKCSSKHVLQPFEVNASKFDPKHFFGWICVWSVHIYVPQSLSKLQSPEWRRVCINLIQRLWFVQDVTWGLSVEFLLFCVRVNFRGSLCVEVPQSPKKQLRSTEILPRGTSRKQVKKTLAFFDWNRFLACGHTVYGMALNCDVRN